MAMGAVTGHPAPPGHPTRSWCLDPKDGQKLAARYADLIGAFTASKAQVLLTSDFTETSDSINALSGKPLGSVTFPSKQDFINEQLQQPSIPLKITSVDAVTCDTVALRWTQTFGTPAKSVAGITVLVARMENDDWRLKTIYTEFNSMVYVQDIGGACTLPSRS
ncbi:hypothetical protein HD806DRAFT_526930 [Xylariaceae sp. AK1471]|nr:hypothetical protein HD806DRAFT_526930 [Xylariaceae sp. AK1471]